MNKVYYDAKTSGFFHDIFHGSRKISVVDQEKQLAAEEDAALRDAADFKTASKQFEEEEGEASGKAIKPSRLAFQRRVRTAVANPILKIIDNPDCRIPAGAKEISSDEYKRLIRAQEAGKTIQPAGKTGKPVAKSRVASVENIVSAVRRARSQRLRETDWTQTGDSPLSAAKKALWADHRKALRDLPDLIEKRLNGARANQQLPTVSELMPAEPQ